MQISEKGALIYTLIISAICIAASAFFFSDGVAQSIKYWIWLIGTIAFSLVTILVAAKIVDKRNYSPYRTVSMTSYQILFAIGSVVSVLINFVNDSIVLLIIAVVAGHTITYLLPAYIHKEED